MIIKPFQSAIPRFSFLFSTDLFFDSVKENFPTYFKDFYEKATESSLFIYKYNTGDETKIGLVACTDTSDYDNENIIKHEDTLVEKEEKQRRLASERQAMIKPVLLTHPNTTSLPSIYQQIISNDSPVIDVNYKDIQHTFWAVTDKVLIQTIVGIFKNEIPKSYIADGHHRASTIANLYKETKNPFYESIFSVYFPFDQIDVSNWNRVIRELNGLSPLQLLTALTNLFDIKSLSEAYQPTEVGTLVMYLSGEWFELKWKDTVIQKYGQLPKEERFDISIFNKEVGQMILGIGDVRTDKRIENIESSKGFDGLEKLVGKTDSESVGFIFSPIELQDMIDVADAGRVMPPKSTYMKPRINNGMIVYPLG
jgi:uncharacterized protein (DUF1015 family)